jgi:hypothetical protein
MKIVATVHKTSKYWTKPGKAENYIGRRGAAVEQLTEARNCTLTVKRVISEVRARERKELPPATGNGCSGKTSP